MKRQWTFKEDRQIPHQSLSLISKFINYFSTRQQKQKRWFLGYVLSLLGRVWTFPSSQNHILPKQLSSLTKIIHLFYEKIVLIPNPPHVQTKTHKSGGSSLEYRHICCIRICIYYNIIPKRIGTNGSLNFLPHVTYFPITFSHL